MPWFSWVRASVFIVVSSLALVCPAQAQQYFGDKKYGEDYEEGKTWTEIKVKTPDYPIPQNLIEFDAGAASRNKHYVDGSTLSVGTDGVVRYVVVVKTRGGATNVSFEGIRCTEKSLRLYAFGRDDRTWIDSRNTAWQSIRPGSYQAVLSKDYFCPRHASIFTAEEGLDALKRGGHPDLQ